MKILSFASLSRSSRIYARIGFILTIFSLTFANLWVFSPAYAACTISGLVYQDYNAGGTQDAAEPGVAGILVTAYQTSVVPPGTPPPSIPSLTVATATTDAAGAYTLNIAVTGQIRVEFTQIPQGLESGRFGAGNSSTTTTTFADCNGAPVNGVDLAVNNPGEYCHIANPQLATSCYVINNQLDAPQADFPTFVAFPYNAQDDPTPGVDDLIHLALAKQTGSTWGLAYHRASDSFLVGSYMKRHAGLGQNAAGTGTTAGAIYRITPGSYADPNPANIARDVKVTVFADLGAAAGPDLHPTTPTSCAPNFRPPLDCWQYDTLTWPLVSKAGLGDVDISEDDKRVYAVNLFNRALVEIPVIQSPTGITAGAPRVIPLTAATIPIPSDPTLTCANFASDWRPFGLGMHLGMVYLGAVCSAESTQQAADLRAYVYKYDPLNPGLGFTQVLAFRLDYPRRCADRAPACVAARAADWKPWSDTWPTAIPGVPIRPEPLLTDITFDGSNMILGFRDRMGDRTGNQRPQPFTPTSPDTLQVGIAAGDILRACPDATGAYILESNATCGGITTAGQDNTQGPDTRAFTPPVPNPVGGEYYFEDMNDPSNGTNTHDEITIGGMVDLPGADRVAVTVFDPIQPFSLGDDGLFDGGVIWLDNATGARDKSFRIFNGQFGGPGNNFGKSNGLGDLEAVCGPPPLEIGNRVWVDLDRNGVQDPGEAPIPNVRIQLYMLTDSFGRPVIPANQLVGQTVTGPAGEYYFNETNVFNGAINGTPIVPTPYINFWDTNQNGTRELHEPVGIMPRAVYEVRLDDLANYGAGAPLDQYYITSATTKFFNDANDTARDSDGRDGAPLQLVSAANFPLTRLTTGDFGDNDHTYDFGFAQLPTPPTGQITQNSGGSSGLTVTKGVDKPFAAPGDKVIWTIHVTNNSGATVSPVNIQDTLPSTLSITGSITVSPPTGTVSVSGNTVTFTQATMNPGQSVTITIPTTISTSITVPFIIVNQVDGYDAQAQVLSVSRLPNTGDSPWDGLQLPVLAAVVSAIGLTVLFVRRRWKRQRI